MATDSETTLLRFLLIVADLDEDGEGFVNSSMGYLRHQVFTRRPFSSWSDAEQMKTAIEAISSLGHDDLVVFWSGSRPKTAEEFWDWIQTHSLPMADVDDALERLTPVWWTGGSWTEVLDWVTTDTGAALFDQWFYQTPPEIL